MGRIFSWKEIKWRKVPKLESFKKVTQKLRKELASDKNVEAGLIYGSALRESDLSRRSDVDSLVIYNDATIFSLFKDLIAFAKKLFVPLEIVPIDIKMIEVGIHSLSASSFLQHLERTTKEGGIIKRDPFSILKITDVDPMEALKKSFEVVLVKSNKSICELSRFEGEKRIILLAKILEAPIQIVRDMVWAKEISIRDESKSEVVGAYLKEIADSKSEELLREIRWINEKYDKILKSILKTTCPELLREDYRKLLDQIEKISKNEILEFITHNAQRFFGNNVRLTGQII